MAHHHQHTEHKHHGTSRPMVPTMVPTIRPAHITPAHVTSTCTGYQPLGTQSRPYGTFNPGYMPRFPTDGSRPVLDGPSTPPASMFDCIPGYEVTEAEGGGGFVAPPIPACPVTPPEPPPKIPYLDPASIPSITEEIAYEALIEYVSSKCCYSSAPAKDGIITNMEEFNTYRYRLETFIESRSTKWTHEPYFGQRRDANVQPPPGKWEIRGQTPPFFQEAEDTIKVPYTSSVKGCSSCVGMGRKPCGGCTGYGNRPCGACYGSGSRFNPQYNVCLQCNGSGRNTCYSCGGGGSSMCYKCQGRGQLLVYVKLTINWTNNSDEYVTEQSSGLQVANLSKVSGKELYKDSQNLVYPVIDFPDPSVVQASQRLVNEHQHTFSQTSRILQQRQRIELIPVTRVTYMWKGESHIYFVYGNEFEVEADNYPATCCCSVYPVIDFPDPSVVQASQRLVNEHQHTFSQTSRILQQRQRIELIPVTRVTYMWKGESHIYFVYGNEFEVEADNYPATCCCSVM